MKKVAKAKVNKKFPAKNPKTKGSPMKISKKGRDEKKADTPVQAKAKGKGEKKTAGAPIKS